MRCCASLAQELRCWLLLLRLRLLALFGVVHAAWRGPVLPQKSIRFARPVAMLEGGAAEDEAAKRAESGKAAIVSLLSGSTAALPFLLLDPGAFVSPAWEFQADGLAVMLLLFGVVYRYAVRTDSNQMLKQGVVGAFTITRSWALISPSSSCDVLPLSCGAPLGYFNWDMILSGTFNALETGAACAAAAFALELCFRKGLIQRSSIE